MSKRLEGKVALVTGAGSTAPGWGIGKATAALFAREGAKVVCADIKEASARETADIITSEGGTAIAVTGDVTRTEDVRRLVATAVEQFGRIDVLQNTVGLPVDGGVVDLPEEQWDRVMDINLKSCFLMMKHVIPVMVEQGGGAIVNISSIASLRFLGTPYVSYYTSKAGMNHMTRAAAAEYASKQVRVNVVVPGLVDTPHADDAAKRFRGAVTPEDQEAVRKAREARIPLGWMGDAWDVARASLFLASDEARFITGAELVVDGGMTVRC